MKGLLTKREAIAAAEDGIFPPYIDDLLDQISDKLIQATDKDRVAQEFFASMVQATRIGTKQALESWRQWVAHIRDAGPEHVADLRRIYETMRIDQQLFIDAASPDIAVRKRACAQLENGGVVHLDDKPDADVAAYLPPAASSRSSLTDRSRYRSLSSSRPPRCMGSSVCSMIRARSAAR